jgi:TonB family protein
MRAIDGLVLAAVLCGVRSSGAAQSARPCPSSAGEPYLVCQVDRAPRPDPGNAPPTYPAMMREAAVGGVLRLTFVVDTAGRVDLASLAVVDSTYSLFLAAAEIALRKWRFEPGREGARPVRVRWEQIFAFTLPPDSEIPPLEPALIARDTTVDGVPRIVVGIRDPEPGAILLFTNGELLDAQRHVLRTLAPKPIADSLGGPRVTVCLSINRGGQDFAADSTTIAALEMPGRHVVIPLDCPKTYAMAMYDTQQRPAGYIDPYIVEVPRVIGWSADTIVMQIDILHEAALVSYRCAATRDGRVWRSTCRQLRTPVG